MSTPQALPRVALTWLLVAQALAILPHFLHVPLWLAGFWLACVTWRVQAFRMKVGYPGPAAKIALVAVAAAGAYVSRGTLIGLDGGVVLLIAAFILKMVEMRSRRDGLVLVFLGFFVVVTSYLFDDSIATALYSLLPVTALLAALIGLQQSPGAVVRPQATLRLAGQLLLQALPLMLLLFVFFPRMEPLWSLPVPDKKGITGLSDSMSPGDVAELSQSTELVFRARFEGPLPPRRDLYWRALTLEHYDGRRWSQGYAAQGYGAPPAWRRQGTPLRYSVVMQPTAKPWLFGLDVAETDRDDVRQMSDFRLQRRRPVDRALLYQVTSWPQAPREVNAAPQGMRRALQLPSAGNPRTRAWAEDLRARYPATPDLVQAVLAHFRQEPYVYTLHPGEGGADDIDQFLFETRRGFCAHYAGAMAFVLRVAGIPARVVAGYQGGEPNAAGNYIQVRQFDAHAWVEYWQPDTGWVSADPTFQVSPERIEQGLEEALAKEGTFLEDSPLSPLRYRNLGWLNELRMTWDNLNYGWQRWVLGYQGEQQLAFLQRWFGAVDGRVFALSLVGGVGLAFAVVALFLFKPWVRLRDPQQRAFRDFEILLARQGLRRQPGEGPRDFARRAAAALPRQAAAIDAFAHLFEAQRYAGEPAAPQALRDALKTLRRAMPWRPGASSS